MRHILRTRCGCERVFLEDVIPQPTPTDFYVPLRVNIALHDPKMQAGVIAPTRRFTYWCRDGEDRIYLEQD